MPTREEVSSPCRVSIVMPTLNQAQFIAESVHSVMSQGVDQLELVVADGGSTDGTLETLAALSASYPGAMRWTSIADGGPAEAVNAAVRRARGAVIGWLNSDDLYAPGAVQRALAHLAAESRHVMVYGEAEHIDAQGNPLGRYPSLTPDTPLSDWADGCHLCQPSAFFRRDAFLALGGLDTRLCASFDFDLWLRMFPAHPGGIGFVPQLQARSRLHAGAITLRMRERVALEGLQVVHRHLGGAPAHWLLTHFAELVQEHPFQPGVTDLPGHMQRLAAAAEPWLLPGGGAELQAHIDGNRAVQCAADNFAAGVHADGWAGEVLHLRLRQTEAPIGAIRLHCRHASPYGGGLGLQIATPEDGVLKMQVPRPCRFEVEVPVHERRRDARLVFRIGATETFVPAEAHAGSGDTRRLAFLLDAVELLPG